MALRNVGFRRLFSSGEPLPLEVLSVETGYGIDELESILARPDVAGRVRLDNRAASSESLGSASNPPCTKSR